MRIFVTILLLLVVLVSSAQVQERQVKATEVLETGVTFKYRGNTIPVNDITYHEFSDDSITWRKDYQEGDCYARFSNDLKTTWWGLNFCTWNGATMGGGGTLDTLYVYYYSSDTITMIDTIVVDENINIQIPQPETLTGSTTNYQDTSGHTHEIALYMGELENVDTTGIADGKVLKYNSTSEEWVIASDLIGSGGTLLTVQEQDGSPSVTNVSTIKVENGHLTDNGVGTVSIDFFQEAVDLPQDFYRAGEFSASAGDNFVTFTDAFTDNDYILVQAYALYTDSTRQNLVYDSLAADGFRVLDVIGSSNIHYLAMRDLDSLGLAVENQGKILASGSDTSMSYLNGAVDDSTIVVSNDELHVIYTDIDSMSLDTVYTPTGTEQKGTIYWDNANGVPSVVLGNDVIYQSGKELFKDGQNDTGSMIYNGTPVEYAGSIGNSGNFRIRGALVTKTSPAFYFIGIATEDIADGSIGKITTHGKVRGIQTNGANYGETWTDSTMVYPSHTTRGYLTKTPPPAPYPAIPAALVISAHASNGTLEVRPTYPQRITESPDVNGTPLTDNGQIMVWNNDSSYFDFDYNILDTTATVNFSKAHIDTLTVDNITYTDTYWDDLRIPIIATAGGAAAPNLTAFGSTGGILQYAFAGTVTSETVYIEGQFSHRIKETSAISPHIHSSPSTTPAATDTAVIAFEYTWASIGDAFPTSDTIVTKIPVCDYAQWQHIITSMSEDIVGIGDQESSIILGRITRLYNNASDTYEHPLFIFTIDIHYEIDKPGSNDMIPD